MPQVISGMIEMRFWVLSASSGRRSPCGRGAGRTHSSGLFFHGLGPAPKSAARLRRPAQDGEHLPVLLVEGVGVTTLNQVRTVEGGAAQCLVPPPARDLPVVPADQHLRNG